MIIGNGDIAEAIKQAMVDKPMITLFASGVSNSRETNEKEYDREWDLLKIQPKHQHIVYFSSLCIYYSQNRYSAHKKQIEHYIQSNFGCYTIIRLGNITWGDNRNTIINFFKYEHRNDRIPQLRDTYRYLITKEEFMHWLNLIPVGTKNEMNITGELVTVKEIWRRVCNGQY